MQLTEACLTQQTVQWVCILPSNRLLVPLLSGMKEIPQPSKVVKGVHNKHLKLLSFLLFFFFFCISKRFGLIVRERPGKKLRTWKHEGNARQCLVLIITNWGTCVRNLLLTSVHKCYSYCFMHLLFSQKRRASHGGEDFGFSWRAHHLFFSHSSAIWKTKVRTLKHFCFLFIALSVFFLSCLLVIEKWVIQI